MATIELRGDPPLPMLVNRELSVHAVVRMTREVGIDELIATTTLNDDDLVAVRAYYYAHPELIDLLLAGETRQAAELARRLDTDVAF